MRAFDAGWGGAVAKTVSLESSKVVNVVPRYGKLRSRNNGEVIGFENIELISDRPIEVWLEEFRQVKMQYPNHVLIASIMEEYSKDRWQELTRVVQDTGVDAFELNFSCPHGMTERKMGSEMGEHPDVTEEVTSWVTEVAKIPVWAKMTPNITNIKEPALAAVRGGRTMVALAHGTSGIGKSATIRSMSSRLVMNPSAVCALTAISIGSTNRPSSRVTAPSVDDGRTSKARSTTRAWPS